MIQLLQKTSRLSDLRRFLGMMGMQYFSSVLKLLGKRGKGVS